MRTNPPPPKRKTQSGPISASIHAWSKALKVHPTQLERMLKRAEVEYETKQGLTAEQFIEAVTFRSEKDAAVARKANADAEAQEMENAKTRKELMDLAQIEKLLWNDCLGPLRTELEQMPKSLAGLCNPDEPEVAEKTLLQWVEKTKTNIKAKSNL